MAYDTKSEPNEFVADTHPEAVAKAVRFFEVGEDELKVAAPADVFGLGARVVVVAVPKSVKRPTGAPSRGQERERGGRGGRERGGSDRGERGRSRDRGRGRDRDRGAPRGQRDESEDEVAEAASTDAAPEPVESKGNASGDLSAVGEFVLGVVERMGLGNFDVSESEEDSLQIIKLEGPAIEELSSEDRSIGALQLLANQAAMRDEDAKRVVIDCEGDAEQHESFLERQVARAARRAKDTGRSVALDPMNGRDRRALHVAVRPIEGVITMSVGTGRYRQVVIVPEGAPEYEEAERAAREAEERDSERSS